MIVVTVMSPNISKHTVHSVWKVVIQSEAVTVNQLCFYSNSCWDHDQCKSSGTATVCLIDCIYLSKSTTKCTEIKWNCTCWRCSCDILQCKRSPRGSVFKFKMYGAETDIDQQVWCVNKKHSFSNIKVSRKSSRDAPLPSDIMAHPIDTGSYSAEIRLVFWKHWASNNNCGK